VGSGSAEERGIEADSVEQGWVEVRNVGGGVEVKCGLVGWRAMSAVASTCVVFSYSVPPKIFR
jgi:hypothetical protein